MPRCPQCRLSIPEALSCDCKFTSGFAAAVAMLKQPSDALIMATSRAIGKDTGRCLANCIETCDCSSEACAALSAAADAMGEA
jgi:hypothetical protein